MYASSGILNSARNTVTQTYLCTQADFINTRNRNFIVSIWLNSDAPEMRELMLELWTIYTVQIVAYSWQKLEWPTSFGLTRGQWPYGSCSPNGNESWICEIQREIGIGFGKWYPIPHNLYYANGQKFVTSASGKIGSWSIGLRCSQLTIKLFKKEEDWR